MPEILIDDVPRLAEAFAARFSDAGRDAVEARGRFAIALPGGSAASAFLPRIASLSFDWPRLEVFWGDERAVPTTDPASNYGLARALWLDPAGVPARCVHRMPADAADLETAAAAHAAELTALLGTPPQLDLVLLGVGPDGHVCSLFPEHRLLEERQRLVAAVEDAPKPPPRRLTLTLPVLEAARLVVIAAMGAEKASALRAAVTGSDPALPLSRVLRRAGHTLMLLDGAAASRLP